MLREFRHQNIVIWDLLKVRFNSVIKLLVFFKINFKWVLDGMDIIKE